MKKLDDGDWIFIGCVIFALFILAVWIFQATHFENPFK